MVSALVADRHLFAAVFRPKTRLLLKSRKDANLVVYLGTTTIHAAFISTRNSTSQLVGSQRDGKTCHLHGCT